MFVSAKSKSGGRQKHQTQPAPKFTALAAIRVLAYGLGMVGLVMLSHCLEPVECIHQVN